MTIKAVSEDTFHVLKESRHSDSNLLSASTKSGNNSLPKFLVSSQIPLGKNALKLAIKRINSVPYLMFDFFN
jgi:hypothetical protein